MMKKWTGLLLAACLMFTLAGCGSSTENNTSKGIADDKTTPTEIEDAVTDDLLEEAIPEDKLSEETDTSSGSNILVVYFARTGEQYGVGVIDKGNTAIVAEMIAEETGADTFEILPANDTYPMTYEELTDVAKQELNDNARPEIAGTLPDISSYDTIFIGAPVWWGDWPMICYTYFEANDFTGKNLAPFSTHAGSGLSGFDSKLAKAAPGATVLEGLAIAGTDAQNDQDSVRNKVQDWITKLGL